jgi:hypothetical protein
MEMHGATVKVIQYMLGTIIWKQLSVSRVVIRIQLIVKQYFEGHILG